MDYITSIQNILDHNMDILKFIQLHIERTRMLFVLWYLSMNLNILIFNCLRLKLNIIINI